MSRYILIRPIHLSQKKYKNMHLEQIRSCGHKFLNCTRLEILTHIVVISIVYELWILRTAVCLQTLTFVRGRAHRTYLSGGGLVMTRQMCAWLGAGHIKANYRLRITGPLGPVLSRPPPYGSPLLHIEMHSHLEVQVGP